MLASTSALGVLGFFLFLILLGICIFTIASFWVLFKKAGRPGWAAIVPIYNNIVLLQTAKMSPWLIFVYFLALIPIVGAIVVFVFNIVVMINLARAFDKTGGFAVGLIFLPFIFIPILAFGSSQYNAEFETLNFPNKANA